ncbi:hypothetical protein R1flu_023993 [Riccia fluitans]|uniref:Uncharacterized protein n=1 Tax=Riccia fluitans TaxID=41844 RepID=A0ABD1XWI6_9MARC
MSGEFYFTEQMEVLYQALADVEEEEVNQEPLAPTEDTTASYIRISNHNKLPLVVICPTLPTAMALDSDVTVGPTCPHMCWAARLLPVNDQPC